MHHPVPALLAAIVALVAYGRWRTDIVAAGALLAAVLLGAITPEQAFAGFANPALPTIALLAVMGLAIRNSGVVEVMATSLRPIMRWATVRVAVFGGIGAVLSAGIGSRTVLSWMAATAMQGIRRDREQSAPILLPISLLASLGGLATMVGTLPNLLTYGLFPGNFGLFGFAATGLPVAAAGLLTIIVAWRFLPQAQALVGEAAATHAATAQAESYTSEVLVPRGSPLIGQTVQQIEVRSEGTITLKGIVRETFRRIEPRADWTIEVDDVLVLACEPLVLQRLMEQAGLNIVGGAAGVLDPDRIGVVEAILTPASELVGRSPDESGLAARQVSLLGIGRGGRQPAGRLRRTKLQPGDVLMLQGELATMPGTLAGLGCLILTERRLRLGRRRQVLTPLAILVVVLALAASHTVPLVFGLLGAVLLLVLLRGITLDELYATIPWPILVVAGALLPFSLLLRDGGLAHTVAQEITRAITPALTHLPTAPFAAAPLLSAPFLSALPTLLVLAAALLTAPFLGGTVTLLLAAPFAAALAQQLGLPPQRLLAALALGASCEFVTRYGQGHSRGFSLAVPGQERPRQSWRLLLPLYAVVFVVGSAAILLAWPLAEHAR